MVRSRGTTEAGARRRAQILDEAEALIESASFDELKMETVADSIGVAKSTLYHYFPQKEDMLFALHEQTMLEQIEQLREIVRLPESTFGERLRQVIMHQMRLIAEHPGRVRVLMDAKRGKDRVHGSQMARLERTYLDEFVRLIQAGVASGEFRKVNAAVAAESILGMTQHSRHWFEPTRRGGYRAVAEQMWQLVFAGLGGRCESARSGG